MFAEALGVFAIGLGISRRRFGRSRAAHAAIVGVQLAPQEQFDLIDGVGQLAVDDFVQLAIGRPPLGVKLLGLLHELLILLREVLIVAQTVAQTAEVAHEVAVGRFGLSGSRGDRTARQVAGVWLVDTAGISLRARAIELAAAVGSDAGVLASHTAARSVIDTVAATHLTSALGGVARLLAAALLPTLALLSPLALLSALPLLATLLLAALLPTLTLLLAALLLATLLTVAGLLLPSLTLLPGLLTGLLALTRLLALTALIPLRTAVACIARRLCGTRQLFNLPAHLLGPVQSLLRGDLRAVVALSLT